MQRATPQGRSCACHNSIALLTAVAPQVPDIALNPTLDGIQNAINFTAKAILQVGLPLAASAALRSCVAPPLHLSHTVPACMHAAHGYGPEVADATACLLAG